MSMLSREFPREIKTHISNFITPSNGSREEIRKCGVHIKNLSLVNKDWMDVCENRLSNLKKDHELLPLGYPAAKDLHLFRNKEGIISQAEGIYGIRGLLNYPTTVRFSKEAILKYHCCKLGSRVNINIHAKTKLGKKIPLFYIAGVIGNAQRIFQKALYGALSKDGRCISQRVMRMISSALNAGIIPTLTPIKFPIEINVTNFKYDSSELFFEESIDPPCDRYMLNISKLKLDKDDTVTSFGAEYVEAKSIYINTYEFATKFFNADEFPEKIVLEIGVKENDDWDLSIHQRRL